MRSLIDDFQFRNDPVWLKYSHERYLPIDDISHRLGLDINSGEWKSLSERINRTRMLQAIPFYFKNLKKNFWYFESDCIRKKLAEVERLGVEIYDRIHSSRTFEKEFILNAAVEESVTSAIYEGANTTRSKAKEFIAENRKPANKAEQMLINNWRAQQWIKKNAGKAISLETILTVHSIVTQNTMEDRNVDYVGRLRDDVVYVGPHEGVDYELIEPSLKEAIRMSIHNARFIHPIIQGMLLHYFIAYIHPFFDGNGRTARTLFYLNGIKHDLRFLELLSISADLKRHGKRYERAFENAQKYDGDITYFVDFSLDSLLVATKVVSGKVTFLQGIWKLQAAMDLSDNQVTLLQRLALNKFRNIKIAEYAADIDRSHELARIELRDLVRKGFLEENKSGKTLLFKIKPEFLREAAQLELGE